MSRVSQRTRMSSSVVVCGGDVINQVNSLVVSYINNVSPHSPRDLRNGL